MMCWHLTLSPRSHGPCWGCSSAVCGSSCPWRQQSALRLCNQPEQQIVSWSDKARQGLLETWRITWRECFDQSSNTLLRFKIRKRKMKIRKNILNTVAHFDLLDIKTRVATLQFKPRQLYWLISDGIIRTSSNFSSQRRLLCALVSETDWGLV